MVVNRIVCPVGSSGTGSGVWQGRMVRFCCSWRTWLTVYSPLLRVVTLGPGPDVHVHAQPSLASRGQRVLFPLEMRGTNRGTAAAPGGRERSREGCRH